jgi:simple sugar transport system permease protein
MGALVSDLCRAITRGEPVGAGDGRHDHPLRVTLGAYLFGILQSLASVAQSTFHSGVDSVSTHVVTVAPFVVMILVLVFTSNDWLDRLFTFLPTSLRRMVIRSIHSTPPAALGKAFEQN